MLPAPVVAAAHAPDLLLLRLAGAGADDRGVGARSPSSTTAAADAVAAALASDPFCGWVRSSEAVTS